MRLISDKMQNKCKRELGIFLYFLVDTAQIRAYIDIDEWDERGISVGYTIGMWIGNTVSVDNHITFETSSKKKSADGYAHLKGKGRTADGHYLQHVFGFGFGIRTCGR